MKKKSIACVIFTLFLSVLILSNGQSAYANEGDYKTTPNEDKDGKPDGTVTIKKYEGSSEIVTIPDKLDGKPVTGIGEYAFNSEELTTLTIPKSVTEIGRYAFYYAPSLTTVKFEEGSELKTIGNDAFRNTKLTTITIPASVTEIESYAFNVPSLTTVEFEAGSKLDKIRKNAFFKTGLITLTIPKSVTEIGSEAFYAAKLLSTVEFEAGSKLKTIGEKAFWRTEKLTTITIPKSVTEIGSEAFYDASSLSTVEFESGSQLNKIGEKAFAYTTKLMSIRIPSSVVDMGADIFSPKTDNFTIISLLNAEAHEYATDNKHKHIPLYQLTYDGNGSYGNVPEDKEEYLAEDSITVLPHGNLEKGELRFVGWNTAPDGSGKKVQAGEQPLYKDVWEDVGGTLYAQWSANEHTITFDSQGGSAVLDVVADYGKLIVAPTNPKKSGHTFAGWYTDPALITSWDFAVDTVQQNMMLYAKWVVNEHTITFDSQGGSAVPDIEADYATHINAPTPPTRSGRRFVGWYTDPALTTSWDFAVDTVQGDMTLYAKWKAKPTISPPLNIQATMMAEEALTEEQLDGSTITVNVSDTNFMMALTPEYFELQNVPQGLTISEVKRISPWQVELTLTFDGTPLEQDHDLGLTIHGAALTSGFNVTVNDTLQIQKNKIPYKIITKEGTFEPTKVWTVKLSNEVDASTVQDALYIVDAEGNRISATFTSEGRNIFIQPPTGNYAEGTYTLYITSKLKNKNGTDLKEPIQMIFTIGTI